MIALQEKQRRTGTYKQIKRSQKQQIATELEKSKAAAVEEEKKRDPVEATEDDMLAMFGINDFSTTKNKDHSKDAAEATYKSFIQKREHRQFMNKRGPGILRQGPM